jgi:hypothetical protein
MKLEKILRSRFFWIIYPLLSWVIISWVLLSIKTNRFDLETLGVLFILGLYLIPLTPFWGINLLDSAMQQMPESLTAIIALLWVGLIYVFYIYFIVKIKTLSKKTISSFSILFKWISTK